MTGFLKMMSLTSIVCNEYRELKLINELNNFYNFDHNIFIVDSSRDINCFINTRTWGEGIPQSFYVLNSASDNISEIASLKKLNSKNTLLIVVPQNSEFENNLNLLHRFRNIRDVTERSQLTIKIGMIFPDYVSRDNLLKLFGWCKEHLIINIFAAIYFHPDGVEESTAERSLNIFSFHPFDTFELINITATYKTFFSGQRANFNQHPLRVARSQYSFNEKMWMTIFDVMNASSIDVQNNYTTPAEALMNGIDFIADLYTQEQLSDLNVYPLSMSPVVICVPEAAPYPEFSAYLRTVSSDKFFSYSLITIVTVIVLLSIVRYIKQKQFLFFQSAADVLNLLMNDNGYINYQQLSRVEVFVIVPLTFVGFIIVNGIFSILQSYLTRPILQHQINTLEDLYGTPLPIITWDRNWKDILVDELTMRTKNMDWREKVIALPEYEFIEQTGMYNRSISFLTDSGYAQSLLSIQKQFDIKGYHNTRIQIASAIFSFFVNERFLFFDRLNEILFRMDNAGLYNLWWEMHEHEIMLKKNIEILKVNSADDDVDEFGLMIFVFYGWLASAIVFVLEIIWKNLNTRNFSPSTNAHLI